MQTLKLLVGPTALLLVAGLVAGLVSGPAAAVTVKNASNAEITIGVDWGAKEKVETVPAGKSVTVDCTDGCGISGPWSFSWMAKGDDVITVQAELGFAKTDGKSLVTVMDGKAPE